MTTPALGRTARLVCAAAAVVASVSALAGCSDAADDRLEAISGDPMTTVEVAGAELVSHTSSSGSTGELPSPSEIVRTFRVAEANVAATVETLAAQATEAGWQLEPRSDRPDVGYYGTKTIGDYRARLTIAAVPHEGSVWVTVWSDQPD